MTGAFDLGTMLSGGVAADTQIKQIPCSMLVPYHDHPFELYTDERLDDMVQSIKENGVLIPIIVQQIQGGKYEILIGHNRWNASKLAEKQTVPAIIKEGLTEEEARMYVIESNLMQRGFDNLKISEQASVIASRYDKMFSQGKRNDIVNELKALENGGKVQTAEKQNSREKVGEEYGLSRNTVARLIRIDKLCDSLKDLVDDGELSIRAGVNLSYLDEPLQEELAELCYNDYKIDTKKSEKLKAVYQESGNLTTKDIMSVLVDEKPKVKQKSVKINEDTFSKYFDKTAKTEEISKTIEKALDMYFEGLNFKPMGDIKSVNGYLEIDPEELAEGTNEDGVPF